MEARRGLISATGTTAAEPVAAGWGNPAATSPSVPPFTAGGRRPDRAAGLALNALLRLCMVYFLAQVLRHPQDPRFREKAIPVRNLIIVGSLTLLFPLLHLWRRRQRSYPLWLDNLYLSIFWLDMAGNSFDLYNRYLHFDLIPHCHGAGAGAVVLLEALDLDPLTAVGLTNTLHILLEGQEYYTDVVFGTHNVRGEWDTIGDLLAGMVGTAGYVAAAVGLQRRRRRHSRVHPRDSGLQL